MNSVDLGRCKRLVQYLWDPEPKNDQMPDTSIWCLGREYDPNEPAVISRDQPSRSIIKLHTLATLTAFRTTDIERERAVTRGTGIEQRPRLAGIISDGLRVADLDNLSI